MPYVMDNNDLHNMEYNIEHNYNNLNNTTDTVNEIYNGGIMLGLLFFDLYLIIKCVIYRSNYEYNINRQIEAINNEIYNYNYNTVKIVNEIDNEDCSICLDKLYDEESNKEIISLDCNHLFHKECVDPWVNTNKNCPLCKRNI